MSILNDFCSVIRRRSKENQDAMNALLSVGLPLSPAFSILRQELDSMVRVIFLLNNENLEERDIYINDLMKGKKWHFRTENGKFRPIQDRDMVEISTGFQGWVNYVYRFGCAFIHLSNLHYYENDVFSSGLSDDDIADIEHYLYQYHGYNVNEELSLQSIRPYIPNVLDKISSNLEFYLDKLESGLVLDVADKT